MNLQAAIQNYLNLISADYNTFSADITNAEWKATQQERFKKSLSAETGKKYIKIFAGSGVHSFIVIKDDGKFKSGDILKPRDWKSPTKNRARGNVFTVTRANWSSADYCY
jgi:hypothetical protein